MKSVCVYCGSNSGSDTSYTRAAQSLGRLLAEGSVTLVYGGANCGLMGALADAALAAGGQVVGVIPQLLVDKERAHTGLTDLRVVESMHDRKTLMAELADGFIAFPGGFGTMEEFCEVVTWAQLGMHHKPCGLLNVNGYYNPLLKQFDTAFVEGFTRAENRAIVIADSDPALLLEKMRAYRPTTVSKWISRAQREDIVTAQ
ncbi:MAG: TIGR00730 family Rossman fold protein [Capsulimonadaceae bacterium]